MTEHQADSPEDIRVIEAGEYVLGVMPEGERSAFETRLNQDPELAREVRNWTEQFTRMAANIPAASAVNPAVWTGVAARIQNPSARAGKAGLSGWWGRLVQGWAVAASVVAVVLSVQVLGGAEPATGGARYVAIMKSPDNSTEWLVEAAPDNMVRIYQLGGSPVQGGAAGVQGKSLQLWTKGPSDATVRAVGLVELGKPWVLPAQALSGLTDQQLFAVSLEPAGGSPYADKPTGPVVLAGKTVALNP